MPQPASAIRQCPCNLDSRADARIFERCESAFFEIHMTQSLELAQSRLLSPSGMGLPEIDLAFSRLMGPGVDFGDLYFQHSRRESWTVPETFAFGEAQLKPLGGGEALQWKLA